MSKCSPEVSRDRLGSTLQSRTDCTSSTKRPLEDHRSTGTPSRSKSIEKELFAESGPLLVMAQLTKIRPSPWIELLSVALGSLETMSADAQPSSGIGSRDTETLLIGLGGTALNPGVVIDSPGVRVDRGTTVPVVVAEEIVIGGTGELEHANARSARIAVMGARAMSDLDRSIKGLCLGIYSRRALYGSSFPSHTRSISRLLIM